MTILDAMNTLKYDMSKQVQPYICNKLPIDTEIESGLKVSEKLCTPGCGKDAVVVEVQLANDWGMSRPWISFYFEESEAKQNPSCWSFETKWYRLEELEKLHC